MSEEGATSAAKSVIVVGAGPGGLSAAMMLASRGYDVTVVEKQDRVGGRNSYFKLGEYTFDIGPTFFMMKDVLERIFSFCGRSLEKYVELTEIDPLYRLQFSKDRVFYPTRNREKMKKEIEKNFPGEGDKYEKYLRREQKKYERLLPCLEIPYDSVFDFIKPRFVAALPYVDAHLSLFDRLGKFYDNEELKLAFTFQAKYIGMSPWKAPGTFSIISYIEHGGGVYHVRGGLNQLAQAMATVVEEEGGSIRLSSPVEELIIENKTAVGVKLESGEELKADYVVLNADFASAMTKMVPEQHRKKYSNKKLAKKLYSCSTFMLYLGIDGIYEHLPHHSIFFSRDYRNNVKEISETYEISEDPSFYVENASVTDDSLAPKGKSALYVLAPIANNKSGADWDALRESYREKLLDLLEERAGCKDIRKRIEVEKVYTPQDWEEDLDVYLGATFNLGHNIGQMLVLRPHNKFEELKNCYLVGGGTHPGSGLPTIYESGRISSTMIMKRDKVL